MADGFRMGPIDPNDPDVPEAVKKVMAAIEKEAAEKEAAEKDERDMHAEARMLELRRFFESLNDEQLMSFVTMQSAMAAEGKHNYLTNIIYGIAVAQTWTRKDLSVEALMATFAGFNTAAEAMPFKGEDLGGDDGPQA